MEIVRDAGGGVEIVVKVVPGASRSRIAGALGDALKVQVAAAPERGRANAAVCAVIAAALGVPEKDVSVVRGQSSPRKVVRAAGVAAVTARGMLGLC